MPRTAQTGLSLPVSVVHPLTGGFGQLHAGSLPDHALQGLREQCWGTPCDAIHHAHTTLLIDPRALDLLHQSDVGAPHETALLKLPDGYVLFLPQQDNQILSVIKDAALCVPEATPPAHIDAIAPNGAKTVFYSVVPDPRLPPSQRQSFRVAFHDGYTHAHEISRFSMADHAIAQLAAAIPLDVQPRVILKADPLGTLFGQCLRGGDADLVKRTFLKLARAAPERIYDTPIETSDTLAQLLQLKNPKGNISLARLRDGVLGYRKRGDGHRSFIFVANSDDFHAAAPTTGASSLLHVYKMQYKDPTPEGPRIFVHVQADHSVNVLGSDNRVSANDLGVPKIKPGEHTVQNVLGLIELAMRYASREHAGCGAFPAYCAEQARARDGGSALEQHAAREALRTPPLEPPVASPADDESSASSEDEG